MKMTIKETKKYVKEFDTAVIKYNEWLDNINSPKGQKKEGYKAFYRGMHSVITSFSRQARVSINTNFHPYFKKSSLNNIQQDAIALASDWQRVENNLDSIISDETNLKEISKEDAIIAKGHVQSFYYYHKQVYISEAMRK